MQLCRATQGIAHPSTDLLQDQDDPKIKSNHLKPLKTEKEKQRMKQGEQQTNTRKWSNERKNKQTCKYTNKERNKEGKQEQHN